MRPFFRALLLLLMFVVALVAGAVWGRAQASPPSDHGNVVSGGNVGFRINGYKDGKPFGQLVIRQNGEWIDAAADPRFRVMPTK
jgi:hypothetical protein